MDRIHQKAQQTQMKEFARQILDKLDERPDGSSIKKDELLKILDDMIQPEEQVLANKEFWDFSKEKSQSVFVCGDGILIRPITPEDEEFYCSVRMQYSPIYRAAHNTAKDNKKSILLDEIFAPQVLYCIICDSKNNQPIAVPYKHLVNQWAEDVKEFLPNAKIHLVHGEIKDAETKILASYIHSKKSYFPIIVITTIVSFFLERYESLYNHIAYEKLLIVDEAHNFANKISDELSEKYPYKLGLSATPAFGNNEEKTKQLLDWFGGQVVDLPIEKALGKYLVNYEYHLIFVNATEDDESKFIKAQTMMISARDPKTGVIIDEEKFTLGYRGRLRAISMAEEKHERIAEIFDTQLAGAVSKLVGKEIAPKSLKQMMNRWRYILEEKGVFFRSHRSNGQRLVTVSFSSAPPDSDGSAASDATLSSAEFTVPCDPDSAETPGFSKENARPA